MTQTGRYVWKINEEDIWNNELSLIKVKSNSSTGIRQRYNRKLNPLVEIKIEDLSFVEILIRHLISALLRDKLTTL